MPRFVSIATFALLSCFAQSMACAEAIDFARQVRPILAENCFQCHGPDADHREADLRFDTKLGIKNAHAGAFVPGEPAKSAALKRIASDDPDQRMPPPDTGNELSAAEQKLIAQWVKQGANWSAHWSFVAPKAKGLPEERSETWVKTPLDALVLRRLKAENLSPSPPADRATWLRRVHLDLTGLPPTPAEVDVFLNDDSPTAWEKQVDRLLASPHYGERWGRHWLDAARYADSDGFEKDKPRIVWPYREWVIGAFNHDKPYNAFITEQIAGDLLAARTTDLQTQQDLIVATGFLRNSMLNEEGGVHPEQFRMEAMFDRMDAVGKAVLGLTINCAQCHSHKYDPLTQQEYYQLFAFLNDSDEGSAVVYSEAANKKRAEIFAAIERLNRKLKTENPNWRDEQRAWEEQVKRHESQWEVAQLEHIGDNAQRYLPQPDGSLLAQGYAPTRFSATFRTTSHLPEIRSIRLEAMTDPNLPAGGPGRSIDGLFALTEFQVDVASVAEPAKKTRIKFVAAKATYSNEEKTLRQRFADKSGKRGQTGPIQFAIDGDANTAWGIDAGAGRRNASQSAVFVAEKNIALPAGAVLYFNLVQKHGGWNSDDNMNLNLGRFRISISSMADVAVDQADYRVRDILAIEAKDRSTEQQQAVFRAFRNSQMAWKETNDRINKLYEQHPEGTTQLVYHSTAQPRKTSVLERGDHLSPLHEVQPGVPAFLHASPVGNDRIALAQWLVDKRSPTTARAWVNRVWQAYFGTGLVRTSEDIGSQSEPPSHPELLDYLAVKFMESGWSNKWLHRQIALSATYRQSSYVSPELQQRDPENRLLARGPRFRVDGEIVRDIALSVSGLLQHRIGGPSVYPPAPSFLFQPPVSYGPKTWSTDLGADQYRRSIYTFRFRSSPYPSLSVFDTPTGEAACIRRSRSNTPLQALATLNEPIFFAAAQELARVSLIEKHKTDASRVQAMFRRCTSRRPSSEETTLLVAHLNEQRKTFTADEQAARKFAGLADVEEISPAESAAWTDVARVMLNLDETITKE